MQVRLAKSAGFCYGVERAVRLAEETARENGGCKLLGSIIHNKGVVADLERKGAVEIRSVDEVNPGDRVLIRAHGVEKKIVEALRDIKGVRAVVLGGSHATGTQSESSDIDIGVYYDAPPDIGALCAAAKILDDEKRDGLICPEGGWGNWVNCGGWLTMCEPRV